MYLKYFLSFYNMTLFSNYNKDFVKMYFFQKKLMYHLSEKNEKIYSSHYLILSTKPFLIKASLCFLSYGKSDTAFRVHFSGFAE